MGNITPKLLVEEATVTINRRTALSVIHCLNKGIGEIYMKGDDATEEETIANIFNELLKGAFSNGVAGVHFPVSKP